MGRISAKFQRNILFCGYYQNTAHDKRITVLHFSNCLPHYFTAFTIFLFCCFFNFTFCCSFYFFFLRLNWWWTFSFCFFIFTCHSQTNIIKMAFFINRVSIFFLKSTLHVAKSTVFTTKKSLSGYYLGSYSPPCVYRV